MDRAALHEAALAYLARRPATVQSMRRALQQRARKKGVSLEDIGETIDDVVRRLVEVGLVDDRAFAASRVKRLERSGRSSRAIAAHLAAKGVSSDIARDALSTRERDGDAELDAALVLAKKRRIGPFARESETRVDDPIARRKELGIFARAGFDRAVAERALRLDRAEADERLGARRSL
jgi:regulatory protein